MPLLGLAKSTEELIEKLSLLPTSELQLENPEKSKAYLKLKKRGNWITDKLVTALQDAGPEARRSICSLLGQGTDRKAIKPLANQLRYPDPRVKSEAALALMNYRWDILSEEHAFNSLVRAIKDPDIHWKVREQMKKYCGKD